MLELECLNSAQREAVTDASGKDILVVAGPGSGKTLTITQRIFFLIQALQVPPEKILVVTFTKDAAMSMQRRFHEGADQNYPVNFGTFHSVFYHILRQSTGAPRTPIFTENQKKKMILPILAGIAQEAKEAASQFLAAFSLYKNTGDEGKAKKGLPEEWRPYFMRIFSEFEKKRKTENLLDFDDMVRECRLLFEREPVFWKEWRERFTHILIDEFQDINPEQYRTIGMLKGEKTCLFAVGDDDQSIYGFRGAGPEWMEKYVAEFEAKKISLTVNYRSIPQIVRAASLVIHENKHRFPKKAEAVKENSPGLFLREFAEEEEERTYLTERLCEETNQRTAVLFRTNLQMQRLAAALTKKGIRFAMKEKVTSIYEHFIVRDLFAYLKLAHGEKDRGLLLQVINKPARNIAREALGEGVICKNGKEENDCLANIVRYYRENTDLSCREEGIRAVEKLERDLKNIASLSLFPALTYILKGVGYERYLKSAAGKDREKLSDWLEITDWICRDAKNYEDLMEWEQAIRRYQDQLLNAKKENENPAREQLYLMTVHASKGLEFERVLIPNCNERVFPHGNMPDEETVEEERRIFYVAMTRAKSNLELLYVSGNTFRKRPSRFLNPLLKDKTFTKDCG